MNACKNCSLVKGHKTGRESKAIFTALCYLEQSVFKDRWGGGEGGGPGRWDKTGGMCSGPGGLSPALDTHGGCRSPPSSPGFCRNHRGPLREPRLRSGLMHHPAPEARSPGTADRVSEEAARVTCSGFACLEGFFVQQDGRCGLLPPGNQTSTLMF